jgi:hypothetical protein
MQDDQVAFWMTTNQNNNNNKKPTKQKNPKPHIRKFCGERHSEKYPNLHSYVAPKQLDVLRFSRWP